MGDEAPAHHSQLPGRPVYRGQRARGSGNRHHSGDGPRQGRRGGEGGAGNGRNAGQPDQEIWFHQRRWSGTPVGAGPGEQLHRFGDLPRLQRGPKRQRAGPVGREDRPPHGAHALHGHRVDHRHLGNSTGQHDHRRVRTGDRSGADGIASDEAYLSELPGARPGCLAPQSRHAGESGISLRTQLP